MEPTVTGNAALTVLGVVQYLALVPLLITAGLALWRVVTDCMRGHEMVATAGRHSASAGAGKRAEGK